MDVEIYYLHAISEINIILNLTNLINESLSYNS